MLMNVKRRLRRVERRRAAQRLRDRNVVSLAPKAGRKCSKSHLHNYSRKAIVIGSEQCAVCARIDAARDSVTLEGPLRAAPTLPAPRKMQSGLSQVVIPTACGRAGRFDLLAAAGGAQSDKKLS